MHTVPVDSIIVTENWVANDSEKINETTSRADSWIRRPKDTLETPKSKAKT
jgi:hypothetical protein